MNMNKVEEMIVASMPSEAVPGNAAILGKVLGKADNGIGAAAGLLAASIANLVGNLPDEIWEEMLKLEPPNCTHDNCNCHVVGPALLKSLVPIRELFNKTTERRDEKGFSE